MSRCDAWNCGSPLATMREASLGIKLMYRDRKKKSGSLIKLSNQPISHFTSNLYVACIGGSGFVIIILTFCIKILK